MVCSSIDCPSARGTRQDLGTTSPNLPGHSQSLKIHPAAPGCKRSSEVSRHYVTGKGGPSNSMPWAHHNAGSRGGMALALATSRKKASICARTKGHNCSGTKNGATAATRRAKGCRRALKPTSTVSALNSPTERSQQEGYLSVHGHDETISPLCRSTLGGVRAVRTIGTLVVATARDEQQRTQQQHTPEDGTQTCEPCSWHFISLNFQSNARTSHAQDTRVALPFFSACSIDRRREKPLSPFYIEIRQKVTKHIYSKTI